MTQQKNIKWWFWYCWLTVDWFLFLRRKRIRDEIGIDRSIRQTWQVAKSVARDFADLQIAPFQWLHKDGIHCDGFYGELP